MGQIKNLKKSQDPNKFHIQTPENLVGHSNEVHVKLEGQVENALLDTGFVLDQTLIKYWSKVIMYCSMDICGPDVYKFVHAQYKC